MKAIVVHQYGGPEVLKFEDFPDPAAKPAQVLVRVAAANVNPIDIKRRSGAAREFSPIQFPGILGADLAGTIASVAADVQGWKPGDLVMAYANQTYAEFCAVAASTLVRIPAGMDVADAAALPVVTTTGFQIVSEGIAIKAGQTILVTGAIGSVGRSAVFTAKQRGARVIAAVRKKHLDAAASLGADLVVPADDDAALAKLPPLDAVADLVGGTLAEMLLPRVKTGGVFASAVGLPASAGKFPSVKSFMFGARPDAAALDHMGQAVAQGKLKIPISRKFPLKEAAAAHAAIESGLGGKVLLLVKTA
ncbi:MAG TPA: NADP-dependent oxidoreductase [Tepidisphaeraceae bacterium]|nr:NADP-dependent oxidoreductase [Tepidisphaeraceae bacterium]